MSYKAKRKSKSAASRAVAKQLKKDREVGQVVNTKSFWQRQTFGPASSVRHVDPKELGF